MTWEIRPMASGDFADCAELEKLCFPPPFPSEDLFDEEDFRAHLDQFPEGQFVALSGDKVIGLVINMLVSDHAWSNAANWMSLTGGKRLANHDSSGGNMFAVDIAVHPSWRGRGVARALYQKRIETANSLFIHRIVTACRLPGLSKYSKTPAEFVKEILDETKHDLPLTAFLKIGMKFERLLPNFMNDPESLNYSAALQMDVKSGN